MLQITSELEPRNRAELGGHFARPSLGAGDQGAFDVALVRGLPEHQEIELVRIVEHLLGEVRGLGRQHPREVRQRLALACARLRVDLGGKDRAAQPCSSAASAYQSRAAGSLTANNSMFWPQGNLPTTCWRIVGSGQASANARM